MRAAIFHEPGRPLSIETIADPRPAADQILIDVAHTGICGSDLHITQYGLIPNGTVLGHEFAGTIAEIGGAVGGSWKIGDRVTALPLEGCNHCEACDEGLPALCSAAVFTGTALAKPGAYAQYVVAKGAMVQRLPQGVTFADGAMVEPLAVAHHAVERAQIAVGAPVLVIGAGPIGAGVALFARHAGARHVIVSERAPERRRRVLELGATAVIDPTTETVAERFAAIAGSAPQIVFECVGNAGVIQHALELTGRRGRVVVAGVCFSEDKFMPVAALMKEISIVFSQCYTERNFAAVIDAIARGAVNPRPMHTRTVGFEALPKAFEDLRSAPDQCKVLIDPDMK